MRRLLGRLFLLLAVSVSVVGMARAQAEAPLRIDGAWARASAGMARNGAAYLTIHNPGSKPDRLVGGSSPVAGAVELHAHLKDGDIMRMRPVMAVEIAPGEPAVFQPGGLHIMLLDLKAPLKDGEHFPLTLTFEKAGSITVDVAVHRTAPGPAGGGHRHPGS